MGLPGVIKIFKVNITQFIIGSGAKLVGKPYHDHVDLVNMENWTFFFLPETITIGRDSLESKPTAP